MVNTGHDMQAVIDYISHHELQADALLHTHGFLEYMEGQEALREVIDITAYMSPLDEFWLAHLDTQASVLNAPRVPFPFLDQQVIPDETLTLGTSASPITVNALHTPGNTPGSTCFYLPAAGIVFTGDVLYAGDLGPVDIPHGSLDQLKNSIQAQLFTLPDDTQVFPGRGAETTIGHEKLHNSFSPRRFGKAHLPATPTA